MFTLGKIYKITKRISENWRDYATV